tara:strand:- start:2012 stop:2476 length:465 start_codon:yes stop_codon:yes gene_type:complete
MRLAEHNELLEDIFDKVRDIRLAGQKEYAHDEDNCFANFERIANLQGLSRESILMTYVLKHVDGIQSYVKGHKSQREDVRGRIVDIIVYLTLLWGMADQDDITDAFITNEKSLIDESVSAEKHMLENKYKGEWKKEPDRFKVEGYSHVTGEREK